MKRVAAITIVGTIALLIWSVATRKSRPVLVHLPIPVHSIRWDTEYAVFNPFRDRAPERVAQLYLEAMQKGDCSGAANFGSNVVLPNNMTCDQMQEEYRGFAPFLQRFRDRSGDDNEALLTYSDSGYENTEVTVKRFGDSWRVVELSKFW
jgi:hypothetical protein